LIEYFESFLTNNGLSDKSSLYLSNAMAAIAIIALSILAYLIARKIIVKIVYALIIKSKSNWDDVLIKNKVLETAIRIIPASVIHAAALTFPEYHVWIQRIAFCFIAFVIVQTLNKLLDSVDDIYNCYKVSKSHPIKGYLQVAKIIAYIMGIIVIVSVLIDRSPWLLLSGIGAATAILLLIFQNSIQGLVAGIQLSANDMVRLGDWIDMPQYDASGAVIEISLHTVKVQNWDKTISTIPSYSLITESFKNWRGMLEAGGRRIKQSVHIDMTYVRFCTDAMLETYKKTAYIRAYLEGREKEIAADDQTSQTDSPGKARQRQVTNLRLFRVYIEQYLKHHPNIHQEMSMMVRQLEPTDKGLPIEIYAFSNTTAWDAYEAAQADIFDHIIAMLPEFDLRVFQDPAGSDLTRLLNKA